MIIIDYDRNVPVESQMAMGFKVQNFLSCIESDKMSWTHDAKGPFSLFTSQLNDLTLPLLYIFLFSQTQS